MEDKVKERLNLVFVEITIDKSADINWLKSIVPESVKRKLAICKYKGQGLNSQQISVKVGCNDGYVRRICGICPELF